MTDASRSAVPSERHTENVDLYSVGTRIAGTLMLPTRAPHGGPLPAIAQGPGFLGLRSSALYRPYHDGLLDAGFAVLVIDYRGFGDSDGDGELFDPAAQVTDIRAAISYLETRQEIDPERIGVFGSGGTGGGNAIVAAALDPRVRAVVSQVPIGDGREWLRSMRREYEWLEFLERIARDRRERARTGEGELVAARGEIMIATPERAATSVKKDVDERIRERVLLASAEAIMEFRPIDLVSRITPRASMFIGVERDATTPEQQVVDLYERAGPPKRLVMQRGTTHYGAYKRYATEIAGLIVDWFSRYLAREPLEIVEDVATEVYLGDAAPPGLRRATGGG